MCRTMPEPAMDTRHTDGSTRRSREADGSLLGEEGQDDLVVLAEQTEKAVGLVGLVALEISVAHDHHRDRRIADLCVGGIVKLTG